MYTFRVTSLRILVILAFFLAAPSSAHAALIDLDALLDLNAFVDEVTNPFFPLKPGTTFFYEGTEDGVSQSNSFTVTFDTKQILGITTTVVHDRAFEEGELIEDTFDWFAQDAAGHVWYFGEDTTEFDPDTGLPISTAGSWEAGVDGAKAGIIMLANPQVGDMYQQERAAGVAEDQAEVLSLNESACLPFGCFNNLLLTKEVNPLDPGIADHKYYAGGVGFLFGDRVEGEGEEHTELVRVGAVPEPSSFLLLGSGLLGLAGSRRRRPRR